MRHGTRGSKDRVGTGPEWGLHHDFKAVSPTSPIQDLKHIRLREARLFMLDGDRTAAGAGRAVGYRSASQFSREYRRLFGALPVEHVSGLMGVGGATGRSSR